MIVHAETAVLGACMTDPKCYWRVADLLVPGDFADGRHAKLFALITEQARQSAPFDAITLADLQPALGSLALDIHNTEGWRTANVRAYAEQVASLAITRRVKSAGAQIARLDGPDVLGQAQQLLGSCLPRHTGEVKHIREYLRASVAELQRRVDAKESMTGLPTGLPTLDEMLCGYQPGDLIVIAARPSVGKTAFTVQSLVNAARHGKHVLFFSLEMTGVKIADRIQAHIAQVNAAGMKRPAMFDNADFGALYAAGAEIAELPLFIDETPALTVEALCARARQLHATQKLDLIAIDYLTQMTPPSGPKLSTADALQIITRALKQLAKELNVPVLLLSQLNREGDGHRPTLRALRDSGAIEQDADLVIFLHRPNPAKREHVILIVEKQRDGETGDIHLFANMRHQRFTETDEPIPDEASTPTSMSGYAQRSRNRAAPRQPAPAWHERNDR
ncbi:replicative DNA helicase [Frateuria edaphi]|uniref:replicative DNA helicase n=1 Tax=Frateuria edaphi TaxID=2898793 RepID=UPI001E3EEB2D|nr:replicative DNA helicase [Frateuria edaphi]UGB46973.1 replicative DNA helicase [Frateuria edaphi]